MKWFQNLKTSMKLISAFVVMCIIMAFVGWSGLNSTGKIKSSMDDLNDNSLLPIVYLTDAKYLYQRIRVNIRDMAYIAVTDQENNDYKDKIEGFKKELLADIDKYNATEKTDAENEMLAKFQPAWEAYSKLIDRGYALNEKNEVEAFAVLLKGEMKQSGDELQQVLDDLVALNVKIAGETNDQGDALYKSTRATTLAVIAVAVLLSILLGFWISLLISRPLNRTLAVVDKVSQGDLRETLDIETKDEVGRLAAAVNRMIRNLRSTVGSIQASAESVAAASQQISASTEEIASGSSTQAGAAQTMTELFRELTDAINAVARSAEQASELSGRTVTVAHEGGEVIRSSIEGMIQVNDQMQLLEQDSNRIGEIIEVIDDIAEQTNLLALNAAIEAARAGEQGRGFAVVADEVRKLAERSGEATKQITSIIKGMQANTKTSVKAVTEGVASSRRTGEAFKNIVDMVNESAGKANEIAAASEQQAAQSGEFLSSIESISAASEEAAASSEETASTAQSLALLAEDLNRSVSQFKIR
ncbi:methyl-accepting chemotaxis protein [Cohnella caldifontis]|uniref:methyl-accepting chemotaxis protein n=1 Tax=Cohnella caldifontis TaxID=3027471 RepID=UPI0023EC63B9|nr:methyl-accepting chemotaxis protein [Cohnella sp. YIM B05605]